MNNSIDLPTSEVMEVVAHIPRGYRFTSSRVEWDEERQQSRHILQLQRTSSIRMEIPFAATKEILGLGATPRLPLQSRLDSGVSSSSSLAVRPPGPSPIKVSRTVDLPIAGGSAEKKPVQPIPLFESRKPPPIRLAWSSGVAYLENDRRIIAPDGREMTVQQFRAARQAQKRQKRHLALPMNKKQDRIEPKKTCQEQLEGLVKKEPWVAPIQIPPGIELYQELTDMEQETEEHRRPSQRRAPSLPPRRTASLETLTRLVRYQSRTPLGVLQPPRTVDMDADTL